MSNDGSGSQVPQLVVRLTHNLSNLSLKLIKASYCFIEQDTLPSLLSTGWLQEWIQVRLA